MTTPSAADPSPSQGDLPVERRSVEVGSSLLSYLAAGPARGEPSRDAPIVLLHGIPASAELWRGVLPLLGQAGFQALAPDLPGYGQTRPDPGHDLSLAGAAEIVAAFLDTLGLGPVWLVGHDLGGGVAQVFASRYPQRLSRLTLGDTVAEDSWPVTPIRLFRAIARLGLYPAVAAARLVPNPYAWWELRRGFADSRRLLPEDARRVFWDGKVSAPEGRRLFAAHLRALDPAQTVAAAPGLASLPVPVQLLWAAQDRFQTWENVGQRLAALLPEPRVDLVKDAGHFLPLERPREYAQALLAWGSSAAA